MSFKENLLKKIKINNLVKQILSTIGPPDSSRKVDKNLMRILLEMSTYTYRKERDLDLYLQDAGADTTKILVLDSDLAIYNTFVEDVALRKSPTVKEMISVRNVIKILSDADVVISKKEESVRTIQQECIQMLDLAFDESDLDEILQDGIASLEKEYAEGVIESLDLLGEILAFESAPKAFKISHHRILGASVRKEHGQVVFGPMVIYSMVHNLLNLIQQPVGSFDREKIEWIHRVAAGKESADAQGPDALQLLKNMALKKMMAS